jgi:protein-S-isoprenylcysteine O-methyltransferase Ste14
MRRTLTRALIFTVTVLSSYLLTGLLEDRILHETERFRPGLATALGMACIVLIFVPLFAYTERLTEALIRASLQTTRSKAGKTLGAIAFVIVVLTCLFALFLDRWFGKSIIDLL